ncbi:FAD binding domain protein [Xylaria digitata]|nr:FAD binding domain protein [Xylaria digitata]
MQGIRLKRQGANVTILEQDNQSERSSHEAGVGFGRNVEEFLRRFDATGRNKSITAITRHFAYRKQPDFLSTKGGLKLSNWLLLYRILRANFDRLVSAACPEPPQASSEDGNAIYLTGKRVTGLEYSHGTVKVYFEDVRSGKQETIDADLVIGADGVHSTVRKLVHAPTLEHYAGYVSWRGSVPEKLVSEDTVKYFENRLVFDLMSRSYIVCYVIPTEDGTVTPGERLLNWVWYYNVTEASPEMRDFFTDIHGKQHHNTVPRGFVQPAVWERVLKSKLPQMVDPFAELLGKTEMPFVTKINDALCTSPSFYNGHVILVGDALTTFRPHVGAATEQAALHCLAMEKVSNGEKALAAHVREVGIHAKSMWLLNRIVGEFGQGSMFSFLKAVFFYIAFLVRVKLGRPKL